MGPGVDFWSCELQPDVVCSLPGGCSMVLLIVTELRGVGKVTPKFITPNEKRGIPEPE